MSGIFCGNSSIQFVEDSIESVLGKRFSMGGLGCIIVPQSSGAESEPEDSVIMAIRHIGLGEAVDDYNKHRHEHANGTVFWTVVKRYCIYLAHIKVDASIDKTALTQLMENVFEGYGKKSYGSLWNTVIMPKQIVEDLDEFDSFMAVTDAFSNYVSKYDCRRLRCPIEGLIVVG